MVRRDAASYVQFATWITDYGSLPIPQSLWAFGGGDPALSFNSPAFYERGDVIVPQFLWVRRVRHSNFALFAIAMFVNVGMWLERFVIIPISLHRDFLPSSWEMYEPTRWDFGMLAGTIGLFLALFFLFVRFLPAIAIFEMRTIVPEAKLKTEHHG